MVQTIPVFYDPRMVASAGRLTPSPGKAGQVVDDWLRRFGGRISGFRSATASQIQLLRAHDAGYVQGVMRGDIDIGFEEFTKQIVDTLPFQVGSLVSACEWVAAEAAGHRRNVACSPSSGFHHARHGGGHSFSTFNGLIVAAQHLKCTGLARRVGIVDFDYHEGDGTQDIIDRLGLGWITHWSAGAEYKHPCQADDFLSWITTTVKQMADCDLLIYQAGADQHVDDPLGGLLTDEQMAQRDRSVFWTCREYKIPLVWNLAGGYRRDLNGTIAPVIETHCETMRQCIDIYLNEGGRRQ